MHNTIMLDRVKREESDWPYLIQETEEKVKIIREKLKLAMDSQKSYANMKRKDVRYEIGEKVFLKVLP